MKTNIILTKKEIVLVQIIVKKEESLEVVKNAFQAIIFPILEIHALIPKIAIQELKV